MDGGATCDDVDEVPQTTITIRSRETIGTPYLSFWTLSVMLCHGGSAFMAKVLQRSSVEKLAVAWGTYTLTDNAWKTLLFLHGSCEPMSGPKKQKENKAQWIRLNNHQNHFEICLKRMIVAIQLHQLLATMYSHDYSFL